MRLDDNQEAVNVERNLIHSLNNRLRRIYNLGYRKGYEDGTRAERHSTNTRELPEELIDVYEEASMALCRILMYEKEIMNAEV